jgi:TPR repeat protein
VEAAKWMRKAADQGLAAGQFGLGSMYAHGRGVPQSEAEAAVWYRKAADQGDTPAMNNLAVLLATSTESKIHNPKEALSVAEKAVEVQPENASYIDTLAMAYFEAGQPTKAAGTEQRALALKPDNPSYKSALEKYEAASRHTGTLSQKDGAQSTPTKR